VFLGKQINKKGVEGVRVRVRVMVRIFVLILMWIIAVTLLHFHALAKEVGIQ
jgi:hypothetical protein